MFTSENEDAICKNMDKIHAENPDSTFIGGGLHSKALKILWQDTDQDLWKSKIDSLALDIEANHWCVGLSLNSIVELPSKSLTSHDLPIYYVQVCLVRIIR